MTPKRILVLNPSSQEAERLARLARKCGPASPETDAGAALAAFADGDIAVAVIEVGYVGSTALKAMVRPPAGVLLTGPDEDALARAADDWPPGVDVDTAVMSPSRPREEAFLRVLGRAVEHARLKAEAAELRRSLGNQETKVKDEKRIAIEAQYVWFRKESQRIESILRKIYGADDVSSLLDILPEIRGVVQAESVTVYILEENEVIGRYLKPLFWDNAFLTHSDFSKYLAPLESQDFAASVARYGHDVSVANLTFDRRLSKRYTAFLKSPLKSYLGVPVMHGRKVIGVLAEGFSREDQQVLRGLSEHMAIAMAKLNLIQFDPLTGLLRPEPFFERVLQRINALSKRYTAFLKSPLKSYLGVPVMHGRKVIGVLAGNRLLRELGHVLKLAIREEDLICRYGGEEFLFFLMGVKSVEEASQLTDRIRKNVEDHYFELQEFQPRGNLTMSFGVTIFPKNDGGQALPLTRADLKRLAGEADLAMAEAKGKRRPELLARGPAEAAPALDKNRVCSFVWEEVAEKKTANGGAAANRFFREKRKYERYNVSTPFLFREDGGFRVAKTANISLEGARVVSDVKLPASGTLDTILVIEDRATSIKSEVVYSEKGEGDSCFYYSGVRFRDLTYKEIKGLENYLFHFRRRDTLS